MAENARCVLSVDIGTGSTKSVLFDRQGQILAKRAIAYPILSPDPATAEQDPSEIFAAVTQTVRAVVSHSNLADIACLSFGSAMHSLILMDQGNQPISNSIIWADNRSAPWASKLKASGQGEGIYRRTGTPIHPMSPLVKLLWLRHDRPDLFDRAVRFISIKEYVLQRLFDRYVVDHSTASASGLLDFKTLTWDTEALAVAGVRPEQLSELVPSTQILQGMTATGAEAIGLPKEMPVVIGANDGVLANLGVGAVTADTVAVTVGTSGAVRAVVSAPQTDPEGALFCYVLSENRWVVGGAINNGGIALRWVRDQLADAEIDTAKLLGQDPYDMLTAIAQTIRPGAEGLIFHPYLAGERSPLWDAHAKASFIGLGMHHNKAHLIRAVLEGVVYNLNAVLEILQQTVGPASSIRAAGGFARSPLWRQMLADVFNRTVMVPESYESSCFGAAILAWYALGELDDLSAASDLVGAAHCHQPEATAAQHYQRVIPVYQRLLEKLRPEYQALAQLQHDLSD